MSTGFTCKDVFLSFEDLKANIKKYEDANFVQLWMRDAKTINAARKSIPKRASIMAPQIKYSFIKYCCIHGGQKFKYKGFGKRQTSTYKKDCPFYLHFKASEDGQALILHKLNNTHNHEVSEIFYKHLPNQRRLPDYAIAKAETLLGLKANKKLLQRELLNETGKMITLRDLSNIAASAHKSDTRNDITAFITTLKEKYNANVEVLTDADNNLQGLFFQDFFMHSVYNAYPEFLCMDATYKLLEIRLPVYILLCEDGAGESEIAAVGLLTHEDAASLSWFVERFKSFNIAWLKTNVFMTDKDLTEREILRSAFPGVSLLLCLFHTMRTFNREITTSKLGITSGERTSSLELIQKLAYATSEEVYDELYRLFISSSPTAVVDYFNKNWHNIRVDWVLGLNFACGNFMNSTNNRLENFNGKLKEVIDCNSSLENFLDKFYVVLASMRNERDHKTIFQMQKVLVDMFDPNSAEAAYKKVLTLYAAQHVLKQMSLRGDINLLQRENEYFMVNTTEGLHTVTWNFCSCMFRKSMHLPCRHIFAARQFLRINLFDNDLCAERWTLKYYRQHQRAFNSPIMADELRSVEFHVAPKKKLLSQHEKFKLALQETSFLATLVSESTGQTFEQCLSLLQALKKGWTDGKVMLVNELIDVDICSSKTESTLPSALTIVTESPINSLGCVC
ncbi:uncharacterized protein LOC124818598 [Hydra vulgaris]|uniref:uncharacterized protein LOC124818598 n=1 Tax=Hydra vulgaris TaxID=6087 RepID=UPI0032EA5981